jgi:hypothetical protein
MKAEKHKWVSRSFAQWSRSVDLPQRMIKIVVDQAIFRVANNDRTWLLLNILIFLRTAAKTDVSIVTSSSTAVSASFPAPRRSSRVRLLVLPLYDATLWTTSTACSSRPRPMRYFGLSYKLKTKKRITQRSIMSPPMVNKKYRHPWFEDLGQGEGGTVVGQE